MITLLILLADMWCYMFAGNHFLHYGEKPLTIAVYAIVGLILLIAEILIVVAITEHKKG